MRPRKVIIKPRELRPDEISYIANIKPVCAEVKAHLDRCCERLLAEEVLPRLTRKPNGETLGKYRRQIGFALMNLYRAWSISPDQRVSLPTSKDAYLPKEVLGKKGFSATVSQNIMAALVEGGYLTGHGSRAYVPKNAQGDVFKDGKPTTFRSTGNLWTATPKLIERLALEHDLLPEMFTYGKAVERVCHIRDKDKQHIPQGAYSADRRRHDRGLRMVNGLLWTTPVLLDLEALENAPSEVLQKLAKLRLQPSTQDRTRSTLYRVFNYNLSHGGRYHGHRVQSWPKELRNGYLLIGEHKAVGLDFKSFNIAVAYADADLDVPEDFDPYLWPECPLPRKPVKKLMVAALNGRSLVGVARATYGEWKEEDGDCPWSVTQLAETLGTAIQRLPEQVQGKFCSPTGFGLKAMFRESEIAFRVMCGMAERGYPVVPIHDGFLCQDQHRDTLQALMVSASKEVLGRPLVVTEG